MVEVAVEEAGRTEGRAAAAGDGIRGRGETWTECTSQMSVKYTARSAVLLSIVRRTMYHRMDQVA